jgi:hypothetical protein
MLLLLSSRKFYFPSELQNWGWCSLDCAYRLSFTFWFDFADMMSFSLVLLCWKSVCRWWDMAVINTISSEWVSSFLHWVLWLWHKNESYDFLLMCTLWRRSFHPSGFTCIHKNFCSKSFLDSCQNVKLIAMPIVRLIMEDNCVSCISGLGCLLASKYCWVH